MGDTPDDSDPVATASAQAKSAGERRRARSSAKAKADLEDDVEELTSSLNTHRFLTWVGLIVIFDAVVFQSIDNWMAPLCLTIIEMIGIFVLARHYEIPEAIKLTFFIMKMAGKRERDPGVNEADS